VAGGGGGVTNVSVLFSGASFSLSLPLWAACSHRAANLLFFALGLTDLALPELSKAAPRSLLAVFGWVDRPLESTESLVWLLELSGADSFSGPGTDSFALSLDFKLPTDLSRAVIFCLLLSATSAAVLFVVTESVVFRLEFSDSSCDFAVSESFDCSTGTESCSLLAVFGFVDFPCGITESVVWLLELSGADSFPGSGTDSFALPLDFKLPTDLSSAVIFCLLLSATSDGLSLS
jgi:hypothetical protein